MKRPGPRRLMAIAACGLLCAISLSHTPEAAGQTVYRCGADGRSYSQLPCEGGRAIDVRDGRSAAQREEAEAIARRDGRVADALEKQRSTEADRASAAMGLSAARTARPTSTDSKLKPTVRNAGSQRRTVKAKLPPGAAGSKPVKK